VIETTISYGLLPATDEGAYLAFVKGVADTALKLPGVVGFSARRNLLGSPQVRVAIDWESLSHWAHYAQSKHWQRVTGDLRKFAEEPSVELWKPLPMRRALPPYERVEVSITYERLPELQTSRPAELLQAFEHLMASEDGVGFGVSARMLSVPALRFLMIWDSLVEWAEFAESDSWQQFVDELGSVARSLRTQFWTSSPYLPDLHKPQPDSR